MNDKLVMVVDDSAFIRKMICMTLAEVGVENVITASDGHKALDLYKNKRPDLVLLDITMDGKNGIEVLAEIMKADPEACVIMCTATGQQRTIVNCLALGAYDYVTKPFQKDRLTETVLKALNSPTP